MVGAGAALLVLLASALVLASHQTLACGFSDDKQIGIGQERLSVEVAATESARQKGLSGRTCIETNEGMFFIFNHLDEYSFWMKDMKFPIDIVWIDSDHKVVTVKPNVSPATYPRSFVSARPAQYVLELQAGRSQSLDIQEGTKVNF